MRLTLSKGHVNIYSLAKNAGTSVDQIERFYARNLPLSAELVRNLQSFGNGWDIGFYGFCLILHRNNEMIVTSVRGQLNRWAAASNSLNDVIGIVLQNCR
jgi:hypothetical protein